MGFHQGTSCVGRQADLYASPFSVVASPSVLDFLYSDLEKGLKLFFHPAASPAPSAASASYYQSLTKCVHCLPYHPGIQLSTASVYTECIESILAKFPEEMAGLSCQLQCLITD